MADCIAEKDLKKPLDGGGGLLRTGGGLGVYSPPNNVDGGPCSW